MYHKLGFIKKTYYNIIVIPFDKWTQVVRTVKGLSDLTLGYLGIQSNGLKHVLDILIC